MMKKSLLIPSIIVVALALSFFAGFEFRIPEARGSPGFDITVHVYDFVVIIDPNPTLPGKPVIKWIAQALDENDKWQVITCTWPPKGVDINTHYECLNFWFHHVKNAGGKLDIRAYDSRPAKPTELVRIKKDGPFADTYSETGDFASLVIKVKVEATKCKDQPPNVPKREKSDQPAPPQSVEPIILTLDVDETAPPGNITIIEQIPVGYTYTGATPPATISYITVPEGSITQIKWMFLGADVVDRQISYMVITPETSGLYYIGGITIVDGTNYVTVGDSINYVGVPPGGISVLDNLGLLAPYIGLAPYFGLASTILVATVATNIYAKRVKRRKEKQ